MKIKVPGKTVDACDICKRESGFLEKCVICGKEYCHICEASMCGCIHQPKLCRNCGKHEAAAWVVDMFAPMLVDLLKKRDLALAAKRRKVLAPVKESIDGETK